MTLKNFTFVSNTTMTVTMNSKSKSKQFFLLHTGYQFQIKTKSSIKTETNTYMYQEAHSTWNWDIYTSNNISWDFSARAMRVYPLPGTSNDESGKKFMVYPQAAEEPPRHPKKSSGRLPKGIIVVLFIQSHFVSFRMDCFLLCYEVKQSDRSFWNLETDKARYVFL